MRFIIISVLFSICNILYSQESNERLILGEEWARKYIDEKAVPPYQILPEGNDIISSKKLAIDIAETILDSIYGSDLIDREKPFEAYNYNGYWLVAGTLPKNNLGGTAVIIMSQKDCKIVHLVHYQ